MTNFFIGLLIGLLVGHILGWEKAHLTVSDECERLGAFYVGKTTYTCIKKVETAADDD